jgi:hypothetical protein
MFRFELSAWKPTLTLSFAQQISLASLVPLGLVYLDNTGSALASQRQLTDAMQEMIHTPFGNPRMPLFGLTTSCLEFGFPPISCD